ncbi:MAG: hypothetical protein P8107_11635 [Spirochaetia bacterium]
MLLKKEFYLFIILGIIFGIFSILVFITRGRVLFFIKNKLRTGALILSITSILGLGLSAGSCMTVTCYSKPAHDIEINTSENNSISLSLSQNNIISGIINNEINHNTNYYFKISDSKKIILQEGEVLILDGTLDEFYQKFKIIIDTAIPKGEYSLDFYEIYSDGEQYFFENYHLIITD